MVESLDGRRRLSRPRPAIMASKDDAAAIISGYAENTSVIFSATTVHQPLDPIRAADAIRLMDQRREQETCLERNLSREPLRCEICRGQHQNGECIYLNMDDTFNQTTRAFRYWCPFHKRPHPMDDCRQLHIWAQRPEQVHQLLIIESASAPAFATDLISWQDVERSYALVGK
ncbi:hypothetical protein F5B21DRAFT_464010 [Xylaria acuta]|nr:hypothetical protein F5B21DRAFT_464010 [Xylaria acuta]